MRVSLSRPKKLSFFICAIGFAGLLAFGIPYLRLYLLPETELFSRGQVLANSGHCREAIPYYKMLLRKDPLHSATLAFLADCQKELSDLAAAIVTAQRLVELDSSPANWRRLLELYRATGDTERASAIEKQGAVLLGNPTAGN